MLQHTKAVAGALVLAACLGAAGLLTVKAPPANVERPPAVHRFAIHKAPPVEAQAAEDPRRPIVPTPLSKPESSGFTGTGDQSAGSWAQP